MSVPILKRVNGVPIVEAVFSGRSTASCMAMVDTGASLTCIPEDVANQIGVRPARQGIAETANGETRFVIGLVASISVGDLELQATEVGVIPGSKLSMPLLGQDFLGGVDLIVKENVIEFHSRKGSFNERTAAA